MCIAFLLYYPRQKRTLFGFEAPYICGYNLPIPDCSSDYERAPLSATELERAFGSSSCGVGASTSGASLLVSSIVTLATIVAAVTVLGYVNMASHASRH